MNHTSHHRLEELLARELNAAQGLHDILTAERAALTGESPDAVQEVAAEKVRALGGIEDLESERRALWDTAATDAAAFGGQVADRWHALLKLMAACRTANEVNGYIVHTRQNQVRQLVDIVRGGAPLTYGPQGKNFAGTLRALARA